MKRIQLLIIIIIGITVCITVGIVYILGRPTGKESNTETEIIINEDNFPNMWVRNEVGLQIDKDGNGKLSKKELNTDMSLSLPIGDHDTIIQPDQLNQLRNVNKLLVVLNGKGKKVKLVGLENIVEIEIRVYAEGPSVVELSKMNNLSSVRISTKNEKCQTAFFIDDCMKVKQMVAEGDGLCELSVFNTPQLEKAEVNEAAVKKLDFHDLPGLKKLQLYALNKMSQISLYDLPQLQNVELETMDKLKKIALKDLPNIEELDVSYTKELQHIDFSKSASLKKLFLYEVPLKELDLRDCKQITEIAVNSIKTISRLNLEKQQKLRILEWTDGNLKKIKWGKKEKLENIVVNRNKLSGTLNLSQFPKLQGLEIKNNLYDKLLGKGHKEIEYIDCKNNRLKLIDLGLSEKLNWIAGTGNSNVKVYLPRKRAAEGYFEWYDFAPREDIGPNSKIYYE